MGCLGMTVGYFAFAILHFFQFILAIVVAGLYGVDLDRARKAHVAADGKWVYAEVVAGISALSALLFAIPFIMRSMFVWVWSIILFVLWIALFGIFAKMYINENPEGDSNIQRMKNAVWIDLVNALLWLFCFGAALGHWFKYRENRTRFTSRARV